MKLRMTIAALLVSVLAGCGGGGGGSSAASVATNLATNVAGLWNGTTSTNRTVSALTFQDGTIWGVYSSVGNPNSIAGVIQANGSVSGAIISGSGADYNLELLTITPGTISATVNPKTSIAGSAGGITFSGTYNVGFDLTPSLAAIAGTFTGTGVASGGSEATTVTIASNGGLSGSSASGCTFSGTATARTDGNALNVAVTFNGGVCANGTNTTTGIAYYDATKKQLISAALNSAKTNGFLFLGSKP